MTEAEEKYNFNLGLPGEEEYVDMKASDGAVQKDRDKKLGPLVEIKKVRSVKYENFFYAPKEGFNFVRIKNPWKRYKGKGRYKGDNNNTNYYIFDGYLDKADKRSITIPQECKLQFSEKLVFATYSYRLQEEEISPTEELVYAVIFISGRRYCNIWFFSKDEYSDLLKLHRKGRKELLTEFPELKKVLKEHRKRRKSKK